MVGEGAALLVRRALAAAGVTLDVERDLRRFLELYDERLLAHTALYAGTREMLDALLPLARLAVLTNKPQHHTERILQGLDIERCFQWVVGGDTPHGRKPDPAGLRYVMSSAGATADETRLIGDSAIDLRTARAAGVRCCLARYGFGFPSAEPLLTPEDRVIDHPKQLLAAAT